MPFVGICCVELNCRRVAEDSKRYSWVDGFKTFEIEDELPCHEELSHVCIEGAQVVVVVGCGRVTASTCFVGLAAWTTHAVWFHAYCCNT